MKMRSHVLNTSAGPSANRLAEPERANVEAPRKPSEPFPARSGRGRSGLRRAGVAIVLTALWLGAAPDTRAGDGPGPDRAQEILALADHLEGRTRGLRDTAESHAPYSDFWEQRALQDFRRLAERATRFRERVEANRSDPSVAESDFQLLWREFSVVRSAFDSLQPRYDVHNAWVAVVETMNRLSALYTRTPYRVWEWDTVRRWADELQQSASRAFDTAKRQLRDDASANRRAVADLERLDSAATRFRKQLDWQREGPRQTQQDFDRLEQAFDTARFSVGEARVDRLLGEDFSHVGERVRQLEEVYPSLYYRDRYDDYLPRRLHDGRGGIIFRWKP